MKQAIRIICESIIFVCLLIFLSVISSSHSFGVETIAQAKEKSAQVSAKPLKLTLEKLKNAEYSIPDYKQNVKLANGRFETPKGSSDYLLAAFERAAFGDLNSDGIEDAAVVLVYSGGGSGIFYGLIALINENGEPKQVAATDLGDRIKLKSLSIKSGVISVDKTETMGMRPLKVVVKYRLDGDKLVEVQQ